MANGWTDRVLPYPLLAPWSTDYEVDGNNDGFEVLVQDQVLTGQGGVNVTVHYDLHSPYLQSLVNEDRAHYVSVVACSGTFHRSFHNAKVQHARHSYPTSLRLY